MTKPNNFILNTDYLALAQTNHGSPFLVEYPQSEYTVQYGYAVPLTRTRDITFEATQGALDMFQIEYNGHTYNGGTLSRPGDRASVSLTLDGWLFVVYRKNSKTITAKLVNTPRTDATAPYTIPAMTFKVSVVSFRPPNLF